MKDDPSFYDNMKREAQNVLKDSIVLHQEIFDKTMAIIQGDS